MWVEWVSSWRENIKNKKIFVGSYRKLWFYQICNYHISNPIFVYFNPFDYFFFYWTFDLIKVNACTDIKENWNRYIESMSNCLSNFHVKYYFILLQNCVISSNWCRLNFNFIHFDFVHVKLWVFFVVDEIRFETNQWIKKENF